MTDQKRTAQTNGGESRDSDRDRWHGWRARDRDLGARRQPVLFEATAQA